MPLRKESYFYDHVMRYLFVFLLFTAQPASRLMAQRIEQDLQPQWQVYDAGRFVPYTTDSHTKTVYLSIPSRTAVGEKLEIECRKPFTLFERNQWLATISTAAVLDLDSLRQVLGVRELHFAFHGPVSPRNLFTSLYYPQLVTAANIHQLRPSGFFRDFSLTVSVVVLVLLVTIIRLNPKLASDYFSVTKIFSLRESEDNILYSRVTSSGNFLFYGFSSLTVGFFVILMLTYLPGVYGSTLQTFPQVLGEWLRVSGLVAVVFVAKMLVVYLFATLFNLRDVAGMQFFNWVRILFFAVGFSLIVLVLFVLARNEMTTVSKFFYVAAGILLAAWIILAFFKIAAKARIGLFHLFSYLCATEIIPSLIIFKILYY